MFRVILFTAILAAALGLSHAGHAATTFQGLGTLPGAGVLNSHGYGVSDDGSTVVGDSRSEAFRWTAVGGLSGLGHLCCLDGSSVSWGASADGSVVVGGSVSGNNDQAFLWTPAGGMVGLGYLGSSGLLFSVARGVSDDGSVVVGQSTSQFGLRAFRWTAAGGMTALLDDTSDAHAVSADGSVVVGASGDLYSGVGDFEAFRWTAAGGAVNLGDLPGGAVGSFARGVSADGNVVVGYGSAASGWEAFRWTAADGMIGLGFLPGGTLGSIAFATSADGSVVVGESSTANDTAQRAFVWDATHGMQNLQGLLAAKGANVTGWRLFAAQAISADGRTIVGTGFNPNGDLEPWLAVLDDRTPVASQCSDGIDNDGDGATDLDDPGCPFPEADDEQPRCDDGIDNDGDGHVDFDDPTCSPEWPYWEAPPCGLGVELLSVLPLIWLRCSRRHHRDERARLRSSAR